MFLLRRSLLAISLVLLSLPSCVETNASPPSRKVQTLLKKMMLEEKLSLVHGIADPSSLGEAGYWPGVPRLAIPPLRFADGPPGVSVNQASTAMPAPIALAATFDPDAAHLYGTTLGREARILLQDVLLGPHINIDRDPLRQNQTTLGEDPYLAGVMAAAFTRGVQDRGHGADQAPGRI